MSDCGADKASYEDFPSDWYHLAKRDHFWLEWRHYALMRALRSSGLDLRASLKGLDVGCGNGVVQSQLENATAWTVDGVDLNARSMSEREQTRGSARLYDIHDRSAGLKNHYDFAVLFDILEHLEDPAGFLRSTLWHLKPGGHVLINVPALPSLHSRYDEVVGHLRRYTTQSLGAVIQSGGAVPLDLRYWGLSLLPIAWLRKQMLKRDMPAEAVVKRGFKPPAEWINRAFRALLRAETAVLARPVAGTSVLAIARRAF